MRGFEGVAGISEYRVALLGEPPGGEAGVVVPTAAVGVVGVVGGAGVKDHVGPPRRREDGERRAAGRAAGQKQRIAVALGEDGVEALDAVVEPREAGFPAIELALVDERLRPRRVVGVVVGRELALAREFEFHVGLVKIIARDVERRAARSDRRRLKGHSEGASLTLVQDAGVRATAIGADRIVARVRAGDAGRRHREVHQA